MSIQGLNTKIKNTKLKEQSSLNYSFNDIALKRINSIENVEIGGFATKIAGQVAGATGLGVGITGATVGSGVIAGAIGISAVAVMPLAIGVMGIGLLAMFLTDRNRGTKIEEAKRR